MKSLILISTIAAITSTSAFAAKDTAVNATILNHSGGISVLPASLCDKIA